MFDISFGEILIIISIAILFVKPEDLPTILKKIAKTFRNIKKIFTDINSGISNILELDEIQEDQAKTKNAIRKSTIIGLDGEKHIAYDVADTFADLQTIEGSKDIEESLKNPTTTDDNKPYSASTNEK